MNKLLVANRSEIAIRCFRAATELGLRTVAVYSYEDRFSLHRFKADEAFLIGPPSGGEPVRSYLNIDALIAIAQQQNVDAIHPGYGFLAESADLARACAAAGIRFVGPTPEQLEVFGDKTAAKRLEDTLATLPPRIVSNAGQARAPQRVRELEQFLRDLRAEAADLRSL